MFPHYHALCNIENLVCIIFRIAWQAVKKFVHDSALRLNCTQKFTERLLSFDRRFQLKDYGSILHLNNSAVTFQLIVYVVWVWKFSTILKSKCKKEDSPKIQKHIFHAIRKRIKTNQNVGNARLYVDIILSSETKWIYFVSPFNLVRVDDKACIERYESVRLQ